MSVILHRNIYMKLMEQRKNKKAPSAKLLILIITNKA